MSGNLPDRDSIFDHSDLSEMFQLFTADCKGSYLKLPSDCSLYKVNVFRRAETEVDVPDEDA